jgi:hypothetical protein
MNASLILHATALVALSLLGAGCSSSDSEDVPDDATGAVNGQSSGPALGTYLSKCRSGSTALVISSSGRSSFKFQIRESHVDQDSRQTVEGGVSGTAKIYTNQTSTFGQYEALEGPGPQSCALTFHFQSPHAIEVVQTGYCPTSKTNRNDGAFRDTYLGPGAAPVDAGECSCGATGCPWGTQCIAGEPNVTANYCVRSGS